MSAPHAADVPEPSRDFRLDPSIRSIADIRDGGTARSVAASTESSSCPRPFRPSRREPWRMPHSGARCSRSPCARAGSTGPRFQVLNWSAPPELLVANREALRDRLPADGVVLDPRHRPVGTDRPMGRAGDSPGTPPLSRVHAGRRGRAGSPRLAPDRDSLRPPRLLDRDPRRPRRARDWLRPACFVIAGNRASTPDPIAQISGKFPHWCEII